MNVETAIRQIAKEVLPDTINGIRVQYDLRSVKSACYYDAKDYILTIMPVEIQCENVAVSIRICPDDFPFDLSESSLAYGRLRRQVEEILLIYIRNIKKLSQMQLRSNLSVKEA